jgi:antitoxin component YwqK of YwqJK toxin-antitoxin module
MTTFNDLLADIKFVIAIKLAPNDLYNFALTSSRNAQIIKNRKVINYHLEEKNEIGRFNHKLKFYVFKHTGKKHGLCEYFKENGQKFKQINFQNDKKHEQYTSWFPNNNIQTMINYHNGKKCGVEIRYSKTGKVIKQIDNKCDLCK